MEKIYFELEKPFIYSLQVYKLHETLCGFDCLHKRQERFAPTWLTPLLRNVG